MPTRRQMPVSVRRRCQTVRGALAALVVGVTAPAGAATPEPRQVEAAYEFTFAGLAGFRIDFRARFAGSSYVLESHSFKEGLLQAMTANYEGRNRAWGRFTPRSAQPGGGSLSVVVGGKPRTWQARYADDGTLSETHTPDWKPAPRSTIPDGEKRGSFDPLSGALLIGMAGDAACEQTLRSNDGKRRIDVVLRKVGVEPIAMAGIPGARGDLLVCEATTRRVAGDFDDASQQAESRRERPIKLWLARLDDTPVRYPAKVEAQTGFGVVRGRLIYFRERPLTEQEKSAVGR